MLIVAGVIPFGKARRSSSYPVEAEDVGPTSVDDESAPESARKRGERGQSRVPLSGLDAGKSGDREAMLVTDIVH
jgi:hypothetical protein